jgi:hypothetical protein
MLADRPDGRRLSAHEQRQLEDLERRLLSEPLAPPRPLPAGLAATGRPARDRLLIVAGLAVVGALLVLATAIGGPGALAATTAAVLATMLVCVLPRLRFARWRPRLRLPRRPR